ncbi:TPA: DEAD/DEAH box helicase, partial [Candidatus Bathyarchaeota archaeon]|nr:DEAD/DEAH box helicase [Candidatus Bathyarchaeota archaeon]
MALLVDDLPIEGAVKDVLRKSGIVSLYPPQEAAIKAGALEGRNLVLASPTASGKTLVAELCALRHVLEMNGKVLYLTPLRALAQEKYETFLRYRTLRKRSGRPIRVGISTGDYDSSSPWLGRFDVIIATNEKCLAPSEEVIVIDRDGVDVTPIGELFDVLAKDSTAIRRGNVIDLVPTSAVYTLSYDEKRNKVVISEVECVTKVVNDREGLVRLRLETGRELLATADHKVFAMREGELAKVESGGALGEPVAVLRDSRGVFHGRLAEEDVLRRLCENGMARSFFGEFDGEVDPDRLARALVNDRRPYRRARELAKYYLKIRAAPLSAIVDIADEIGVREIRGLRRDSAERVPRLLRLTEDLGKILGYYVSEGTLCGSKKPYGYRCLRLSVESGWVAHDIVRSIRRLGLPYKVRASSDGSRWEVRVVGRVFATLVGKVWRLGSSPSRKAIPRFAFFAPDAFVAGLVAGLLNGGAVPKPTAIEYPTRSRSLALQLALLLTRFDVHARIC